MRGTRWRLVPATLLGSGLVALLFVNAGVDRIVSILGRRLRSGVRTWFLIRLRVEGVT